LNIESFNIGDYLLCLIGAYKSTIYTELISVLLFIILLFSGIFYGILQAISSLSKSQISTLKEVKDSKSIYTLNYVFQPQLLRFHILSLTYCMQVVIAVSYLLLFRYNSDCYTSFTLFIFICFLIVFILLFGRIIPNIVAKKTHLGYLFFTIKFLNYSINIITPLYNLLKISKKNNTITEDLAEALNITSSEFNEEKEILEGIVKLKQKNVSSIMTPRVEIFALEISTSFSEIIPGIINSGYSRIPVYTETLDSIKGILYVKDILPHLHKNSNFRWQTLIRPPYFIPESKKIDNLLEEFQKTKIHLAVVIDEYGGTCGIVTLEDILEEILGEINDEFDEINDEKYTKIDEKNYLFYGKTGITDVCKILNLAEDFFDLQKGDADSLAGLILEMKGDFPNLYEEFEYNNLHFKIEEEDKRRILKIKITIH
jgi:putative hemolysin